MSWRVPFVDFPRQFELQEPELMHTIRTVLAGGDLIMRKQLVQFEENLADFVGVKHAVGVSNCTDGLRLLAAALGVGPGDEAVTVAHTFVATISPFKLAGATPVLVDVGEDHNMDPGALRAAVSPATRVIIPVHLNGRICDMAEICEIADRVGATVIEDAAQALGARYRGKNAGTFGRAAVFSFYPAKLLGALGDAGAVVTDDDDVAEQMRLLRDHGRADKSRLAAWGYNCRLDNVQAAILDLRLSRLAEWIERRRVLARHYDEGFRDHPGVSTLPGPDDDSSDRYDVYQNYPILVDKRDALVAFLASRGIEVLVSWPVPMHKQSALGFGDVTLPMTERISDQVLSLPLFPELTDSQVDAVIEAVHAFFAA